ncbi:xanthine dehydrogenase family protein molybdopterin-binding subunit [Rhizorhabdus wittichii]|uniref:Xanthine dehydrogenase family protein molybdopterin-binding subunit n=1 Tax=Rhizorhabdus wittichii TaxID=160791 RepID=A0A975D6J8_9SPHN|nr:xanthine dehydrogenase family protein molybdopterin-binding subunit [Rhizorhabdus wittichii]QTH23201.1 xanthine dehydrogenase family protein molybdopterin-binding subunit [Rhizorhabdus wittichii]
MDAPTAPGCRSTGSSVQRRGLARIVAGKAAYVPDQHLPGTVDIAFARSSVAHAHIRSIDAGRAAALPGVVAVRTMRDLPHLGSLQSTWDVAGQRRCPEHALATDRLRHVGQAFAVVVANDRATAERAAALVEIDLEPLPAILSVDAALEPDAPRLYPDWPDNEAARFEWLVGDPDAALDGAALIVEENFTSQRVHPLSLETRGIVAAPDGEGGVTLWVSTQAPHQVRMAVALALGLPEHRLRVIVPNVGGGFGMKAYPYAEEALLARLALDLDRPVRWIEGRRESFVSSVMGRDQRVDLRVGFDATGRILALDGVVTLDKGALIGQSSIGTAWVGAAFLPGGYAIPTVRIVARAIVTNTPQTGAYRGYGQPEANLALERTLDIAATRLGISPADIRRRNFIAPAQMPHMIATGVTLDSGDYPRLLDMTLERFGYEQARARCAATAASSVRRGVGIACYIETSNMAPSAGAAYLGIRSGSFDLLTIRMEPTGHVRVDTGQTELGQGISTTLAQLCADELMMPAEDVVVAHGDTALPAFTSYGTAGSAGAGVGGAAAIKGAAKLRDKLLLWGAHLLQLDAAAVELASAPSLGEEGRPRAVVRDKADPGRQVAVSEIARAAYFFYAAPDGVDPGLEASVGYDPPGFAISYGTVAVEVAVDAETGKVTIERMTFGHDCGRVINPAIVEGQISGAVAQAIGATLYEAARYDEEGRPLSTSLMDYMLPLAADMPPIDLVHLEIPSPLYPHGVKGVGESGTIAVPAAIMNAVQHAIGPETTLTTLPLSAERVWEAMRAAG